jgi:hypothetical protein
MALLLNARGYLAELLPGDVSSIEHWKSTPLPYFLLDSFDLAQLRVHRHQVILAASKAAISQQILHRMLRRISGIADCRVLYVAGHLSAYERKRLLAERVEFVVPGSQLFAPSLAINLRENTATSPPLSQVLVLTPATQAVLLTLLLSDKDSVQPLATARSLGYSPMTASRIIRELEAAGLAKASRIGSKSLITLAHNHFTAWQQAKPLMRSPVTKQLHVTGPTDGLTLAGESALAALTLLNDPQEAVYAIHRDLWRASKSNFTVHPFAELNTFSLQIWSYAPSLLDGGSIVDPLSLISSLEGEEDERVQIAMEELESAVAQRWTE